MTGLVEIIVFNETIESEVLNVIEATIKENLDSDIINVIFKVEVD